MNKIETGIFPERFTISPEGMRDLNKDRFEGLIYELVQNVFDQDSATTCSVRVVHNVNKGVRVTVTDDGDGFANPRFAYEMHGPNDNRSKAEKRGRFNAGEKQAVSVATEAKITTVGYTIEFPPTGGRVVRRNRRTNGTEVRLLMPWSIKDAEVLREKLRLIRPPDYCTLAVNGKEVTHPAPVKVHEAVLETVIQNAPDEPMRRSRRKTRMEISNPAAEDDKARIYEMGLPVQEIDAIYDVNVMQKIPQNINRDTVKETYLQDIYAELLNAMHEEMPREEFGETWVRTAVEDNRISEGAAHMTVKQRFGEKTVIWSANRNANLEAIDQGFQVIHPRTMSKAEREHLRERGGLEPASARFGHSMGEGGGDSPFREVDVSDDPVKLAFADWVVELGTYVGVKVFPKFIHNTQSFALADCMRSTKHPTMRFNLARLPDEFFEPRGEEQLSLVVHELGHAVMTGEFTHGYAWGNACAKVGAMIALKMAQQGSNASD